MAELIDREALLRVINEHIEENGNQRAAQVLEGILYAPAVDAVEVVRCKDCIGCKDGMCENEHVGAMAFRMKREPEDFCSYGERKETT